MLLRSKLEKKRNHLDLNLRSVQLKQLLKRDPPKQNLYTIYENLKEGFLFVDFRPNQSLILLTISDHLISSPWWTSTQPKYFLPRIWAENDFVPFLSIQVSAWPTWLTISACCAAVLPDPPRTQPGCSWCPAGFTCLSTCPTFTFLDVIT